MKQVLSLSLSLSAGFVRWPRRRLRGAQRLCSESDFSLPHTFLHTKMRSPRDDRLLGSLSVSLCFTVSLSLSVSLSLCFTVSLSLSVSLCFTVSLCLSLFDCLSVSLCIN